MQLLLPGNTLGHHLLITTMGWWQCIALLTGKDLASTFIIVRFKSSERSFLLLAVKLIQTVLQSGIGWSMKTQAEFHKFISIKETMKP